MIYVVGCGGHGRSIADVLLQQGRDFVFIDGKAKPDEVILGKTVLKTVPQNERNAGFILAIGENWHRQQVAMEHPEWDYISVIADDAYVGAESCIMSGSFVGHRAYIGPRCRIGKHTIINTASVVEHDCKVDDYCHVAPHATLLGGVTIGKFVLVGGGVTVKNSVHIDDEIVVGAGATVVCDLSKSGVYLGTPARELRKR